jgi:thiol-disulfide isomerase/thioredoxin
MKALWFSAAAIALVGVIFLGGQAEKGEALAAGAAPLGGQQVGGLPQDFDLRTLDGGHVKLSELQGEVVFLNFWATWCPPCLEELPDMAALSKRLAGRGFHMVAVSQDNDWQTLQSFFARSGGVPPGLTVALDPGGRLASMYGTEKLPETYVIGRTGRVLARWVNAQPWKAPEMFAWFDRALASGL